MTPGTRRELYRWGTSGVAVLAAHVAVAGYVLSARQPSPPASPPAAIVIDLAPIAAAPEIPEMDLPPAPPQPDSQSEPEQPVEEIAETQPPPEPEPPPPEPVKEPPPVQEPEVPLPPPPPETKVEREPEKVEPPKRKPPRKPSVAAAPRPQPERAKAAAPVASSSEAPSNAIPNWRSLMMAILERNKRYPPEARSRGDRGTSSVRFSIDRGGRLVGASLVGSSGSSSLDEEALSLVRRSAPFPPPPPEMRGNTITLVVPVRFNFR